MNQRNRCSSRATKVRWLVAHQSLWAGFLPDNHQNWRDIINLMKAEGLVAPTTYPLDVNLPSLIAEAHGS
jgi:hypothetical protein